jgi:hypothetical protein
LSYAKPTLSVDIIDIRTAAFTDPAASGPKLASFYR